jgi:hypothetical protein
MTPSLPSLLLLLLLALWPAPYLAARAGTGASDHGLTHIHLYMHETFAGPNATTLTAVPSPLGADATFGAVGVLGDELRDGAEARNSSLIGRYQGLFVSAGLVSPSGAQSAINLVFTAGERRRSTLAMLGPVLSFTSAIERAVVGQDGERVLRYDARRQPHAGVPRLQGRPVPGHVPCLIDFVHVGLCAYGVMMYALCKLGVLQYKTF